MKKELFTLIFLFGQFIQPLSGQDSLITGSVKPFSINSLIRTGGYFDLNRSGNDPLLSSAFSDIEVKIESGLSSHFLAKADLRYRYGSEFSKNVNAFDVREAYIEMNGSKWRVNFGQKILKWGRADFTNPTSKFNPQNLISRSPDREDMDMGNILAIVDWFPAEAVNFEAVLEPFYRSSRLIIDPVPLPANTTINQIEGIVADKQLLSYGFKADFHLTGIDFGISWFDGYDPMPGISLTDFRLDLSGSQPAAITQLTVKPYKIKLLGADFESAIGNFGIRGEASWSVPCNTDSLNEYIPLEEFRWVAGIDWSSGNFRITGEYNGKYLPKFRPSLVNPIIGTEPDYETLAGLYLTPGFDLKEYVRQQVGAFNRLYNYQLKESYHSAGIRIESEMFYGKLLPSLFTSYNFTTKDFMIAPEVKYKPFDGLTIYAGAEIFEGKTGSLYDLVHDFMNTVYVAMKVNF